MPPDVDVGRGGVVVGGMVVGEVVPCVLVGDGLVVVSVGLGPTLPVGEGDDVVGEGDGVVAEGEGLPVVMVKVGVGVWSAFGVSSPARTMARVTPMASNATMKIARGRAPLRAPGIVVLPLPQLPAGPWDGTL
jgi:hypothetical protein